MKQLNDKLAHIPVLRAGTVIIYPGKALGVSYSEEGLKYLCTNRGDLLYYKDALYGRPSKSGKPHKPDDSLIVEDFIPRDHILNIDGQPRLIKSLQSSEIMCVDKALRMLYVPSGTNPSGEERRLVHTSSD